MKREFNTWFETRKNSLGSWTYYTDFNKVYKNVYALKRPLALLSSLINSKNIKEDFLSLIRQYPEAIEAIPILIAKRNNTTADALNFEIDESNFYEFDFRKNKLNNSEEEYCLLMENTGIFDLLQNNLSGDLFNYVTGVEVGLDSHSRKNGTGVLMENLVADSLKKAGFIENIDFFRQVKLKDLTNNVDATIDITEYVKVFSLERKVDYVLKTENHYYIIETNFYNDKGSKLTTVVGDYLRFSEELNTIPKAKFIWITDGAGWNASKNTLHNAFNGIEHLYNIQDLKNGILNELK